MRTYYSLFFTLCVLVGTLALATKNYEFGAFCIALALAPLIIIRMVNDVRLPPPVIPKKNTKNSTKKDKKTNTTHKSTINKLTKSKAKTKSKSRARKTRKTNKNNDDKFFDITDAWNSI